MAIQVCEQMQNLRKLLDKKKISWEDHSEDMTTNKNFPIWICRTWFKYNGIDWSVINGFGTYGGFNGVISPNNQVNNLGLLELWNGKEDPVGFKTADEVLKIILEEHSSDN